MKLIQLILLFLLSGCTTPCQQSTVQTIPECARKILPMACMVEVLTDGERFTGGSGTCISVYDGNAYILTAKHVVNAYPPTVFIFKDDQFVKQPRPKITLRVKFWEYNNDNCVIQTCEMPCKTVWKAKNADAAIVKVVDPPCFVFAAELAMPGELNLYIGRPIARTGCIGLLPPLIYIGYLVRFDVYILNMNDHFMFAAIGTGGGDSGSAIYDMETWKVIGITVIGLNGSSHLGGCVPIDDITDELFHSKLNFILGG